MVTGSSPSRHIVAMPQASVSPYPVITVSKPSVSPIASINSTGTDAAPVTARRRLASASVSRSGWFSMLWYSVGGPGSIEICSAATRSITLFTSNTGSG